MFSKSKCTIADTATDIYPKTCLEIISENQCCILAGSGYEPGSVIINLFPDLKWILDKNTLRKAYKFNNAHLWFSKLFREYFYLKFILDPEKGWIITDTGPYPDPAKMQNWFSEIVSRNVFG